MSLHPRREPFQQSLEEHHELRDLNRTLRRFLEEPRPGLGEPEASGWTAVLHRHLSALHEKLVRHFRAEEEGGILDELSLRNPRAVNQIKRFREEHGVMLRELRQLVADTMRYAEAEAPANPRLRQRTRDLLECLAGHEAGETDLIQDLLLTDISAGD